MTMTESNEKHSAGRWHDNLHLVWALAVFACVAVVAIAVTVGCIASDWIESNHQSQTCYTTSVTVHDTISTNIRCIPGSH